VGAGDVVLMGPPGSGKGTQARLLVRSGWVHLATGDLFREHVRRGTPLGELAARHMSKGEYVPDDVTVEMVRERVASLAPDDRVVFDGFPRTLPQAEALDGLLAAYGRRVAHAVVIDVPHDELVRRLTLRGEGRPDDAPDVIRRRLDVYEDQTRPVVGHYERAGALARIEGIGGVEDIARRVAGAIA